jgi:hypothetical protein
MLSPFWPYAKVRRRYDASAVVLRVHGCCTAVSDFRAGEILVFQRIWAAHGINTKIVITFDLEL